MAAQGLLLLQFLNIFCCFVSSLYFHMGKTEQKCFIEELPDDALLVGNYHTQLYDTQTNQVLPTNPDQEICVEVTDPDSRIVLFRQYRSEGSFRFRSQNCGKHRICLQSRSSEASLSGQHVLVVHLDIDVGERINNTLISAKDKMTQLQLRVQHLSDQVEHILKQQHYHRIQEKSFRDVVHNTNMWLFWWPVVQSLYVVAIIIWVTGTW